jgi:hypothetical protein
MNFYRFKPGHLAAVVKKGVCTKLLTCPKFADYLGLYYTTISRIANDK